ncbi:MAG: glucosidase family protein [Anaerolineae bacterium]
MTVKLSILWNTPPGKGTITLRNAGTVTALAHEQDQLAGSSFTLDAGCRLMLEVSDAMTDIGPCATVVTVRTERNPFSFFLRDVSTANPIYIPQYGVVVTEEGDVRTYAQIVAAITTAGRQTALQAIANQPEESFEAAAVESRDLKCVTWLGLSRDIRNFEVNFHALKAASDMWDSIQPKYHGMDVMLPELGGKPVKYDYFCGRGFSNTLVRRRWLEQGVLPILNTCLEDGEVQYNYKIFVTLEASLLTIENVAGTHYLVADRHSHGSMMTEAQTKLCDQMHDAELDQPEETVCFVRIQAVNTGAVPRYSYLRIPQPNVFVLPDMHKVGVQYDGHSGMGSFSDDRVFLLATVNGQPVPAIEMAVLLAPGEKAEYVFKIPHRPIPAERAKALANVSFDDKLAECTAYWQRKLGDMAALHLPEQRIDEMMRAGVLHCDLVAYGREPDGAVAATIGVYSPIGSESSPIIQYLDAMGLHDLARRTIMYFVEKQHDDGFMQNFGGYMLETGCVLWTIGEHWRYTRDTAWITSIRDNIVRAVDYLIAWRNRNKREELRGHGYGMLDGKVADPEDNYHIFMLNSTAYIGLKRAAEVLAAVGDLRAAEIAAETADFLLDITDSVATGFAEAPVVPLGNGAWCPSVPVWAENPGPLCLQTTGGTWFTHGAMVARDTLLGAQYMLLDEVIDCDSTQADFILNCLADLFFNRNTAFSQPYYSPHPLANLRRGEVKAYLKEFYSNMSSLADRETYTFWEHLFYASPHKTHEEGWFLMRCRWMLYLEDGDTLKVLPGIPHAWLEDGKEIVLDRAATYFGKLSLKVVSQLATGRITVRVKVDGVPDRLPKTLSVRIPHPQGMKAKNVSAGKYDEASETVTFEGFGGEAVFEVRF